MELMELMAGTGAELAGGATKKAVEVTSLTADSREVEKGALFVAVSGAKEDGARYIDDAVKRGAVAVLAERKVTAGVPVFVAANARQALALAAANFYKKPASELTLLGVTGTNGKTTTTYLLDAMCAAGGLTTGLVGTLGYRFGGNRKEATHTTPDAITLHKLFREMVEAGTDTVVMEVSSHALAQERVHGLTFRAAAFTHLTRDHLDYHKDLEDYFQAKRRLFSEYLSPGGVAVVNGDDTYACRIYSELRGQKRMAWKFSTKGSGELSAVDVEMSLSGIKGTMKTPAGDIPIRSALVGAHNLENILAAAGIALGAGLSRRDVQDGIERVRAIPGRMERIEVGEKVALVDYAHSDDALRRVLESARTVAKGRVLALFGCGGDRDEGKRPLMGQAAGEAADLVVVTSDNPRSEEPEDIIEGILPGLEKAGMRRISGGKARAGEKGFLVEADRRQALRLASSLMKPGDVLLVAGKGHEAYQWVGSEKRPFDDREETRSALEAPLEG